MSRGARLVVLLLAFFAARGHFLPRIGLPLAPHVAASVTSCVPGLPSHVTPERHRFTDSDRRVPLDLYGNPVTDAVARYRLDATGSLYELHSPETELPRLGSPVG